MPEFFEQWLKSLTPEQKDKVWDFVEYWPSLEVVQAIISQVGRPDGRRNTDV